MQEQQTRQYHRPGIQQFVPYGKNNLHVFIIDFYCLLRNMYTIII